MATSTIPAFKAALYARLRADTSLGAATPPVSVTYGLPPQGQRDIPREWVHLGNTRDDDPTNGNSAYPAGQSTGAMGQLRREERYVLEVDVRVVGPGMDGQQTCTERVFTIAAAIENSLRTWTPKVDVVTSGDFRWALVTRVTHDEGLDRNEADHVALVHIDIACAARI